jgi:hypothetical protein
MAHPEGFEPPTSRFVVWHSIQLNYGCIPKQKESCELIPKFIFYSKDKITHILSVFWGRCPQTPN